MKPTAFYMRRALRECESPEDLRAVGLHVVSELEALRAWVREQGLVPPRRNMLAFETAERLLAQAEEDDDDRAAGV